MRTDVIPCFITLFLLVSIGLAKPRVSQPRPYQPRNITSIPTDIEQMAWRSQPIVLRKYITDHEIKYDPYGVRRAAMAKLSFAKPNDEGIWDGIAHLSAAIDIVEATGMDDKSAMQKNIEYRTERAQFWSKFHFRKLEAEDLKRITDLSPGDIEKMMAYATAMNMYDHKGATQVFEAIIREDSQFVPAYVSLAVVQGLQGNICEAHEAYRTSNDIEARGESVILWGTVLIKAGRYHDAIDILRSCVEPQPGLSSLERAECNYQIGIALHGIGRISVALDHFQSAIEIEPGREHGLTYYDKAFATYTHQYLDAPVRSYVLEQVFGCHFLDAWGVAGSGSHIKPEKLPFELVLPSFNPAVPDVARMEGVGNEYILHLLDSVKKFKSFRFTWNDEFEDNPRHMWTHALSVLDVSQHVRDVFVRGIHRVSTPDSGASGGCNGGFGLEAYGLSVGFAPGKCKPNGYHDFSWRDAFDVAIKWRLLNVNEPPVWSDVSLGFRGADEGHTHAGYADVRISLGEMPMQKYTKYYQRCFDMFKDAVLKQANGQSYGTRCPSIPPDLAKMVSEAQNVDEVGRIVGYGITQVPFHRSNAVLGELLVRDRTLGTPISRYLPGSVLAVTPSRAAPNRVSFSLRTYRDRRRMHIYNGYLKRMWNKFVELGNTALQVTSTKESKELCAQQAVRILHGWLNLLPINKGAPHIASSMLQGLWHACGVEFTGDSPDVLLDLEAVLTEDPDDYVKFVFDLLLPNGISTPKYIAPLVHEILPTNRMRIGALNMVSRAIPMSKLCNPDASDSEFEQSNNTMLYPQFEFEDAMAEFEKEAMLDRDEL